MNLFSFIILLGMMFGMFLSIIIVMHYMTKAAQTQLEKRIGQRLDELLARRHPVTGFKLELLRESYRKDLSSFDRLILNLPHVESFLDHTDYLGSVRRIRHQCIGSMLACPVVVHFANLISGDLLVSLAMGFIPLISPYVLLKHKANRKLAEFETQLPEALDSITRALRAGYPFSDTIRMIAEEFADPLGAEFKVLFEEINAGIELRQALLGLSERVPSVSVMAFTTTVNLQRETGGNLSETLTKISVIIRKRFNFRRNLKTLTAEGRMSGWVLGLLPLVLFCLMYLMDPETAGLLIFDPVGRQISLVGFGLLATGIFWMNKITSIEV